ncbi:MAG: SCP2 sterol-binding domain-containing protein [Candidatus Methanoglobus sp.]
MSEAKDLVKKMCDIQNQDKDLQASLKGWKAVVQYQIDNDEFFYVVYKEDGTCEFKEGKAEKPTFTIIATSKFWCDVLRGKEDPVASFMMGKYKITGNVMESQKLAKVAKQFRGKYTL